MVKVVIGDETQLKLVEKRLVDSALPSQVGLVIGKLSSSLDRGFVYDLVPTPLNDAGEPPCSVINGAGEDNKNKKKSSSSKSRPQTEFSALFVDNDWVSEHGRQVSRMLLGGMKVIGIYIWIEENLFKNSTSTLCQTVRGFSEAASSIVDCNDRLLIHISYGTLRWSCRNCSVTANISSTSTRPCDFKMGKVFGPLQTFRCTYNFDVRLPIRHGDEVSMERLFDMLHDVIANQAKELDNAKALINGKLVTGDDDLCVSDDFHEESVTQPLIIQVFVLFEACIQKRIFGVLHFRGSVCSLSYLNSKEPLSQALVDIKEDIVRSLRSRLDILRDEGVNVSGTDPRIPRKPMRLPFPRRVFVPWAEGAYICDHIQLSETPEVVKDRCRELMSVEIPADDDAASEILEPESEAVSVETRSSKNVWDVLKRSGGGGGGGAGYGRRREGGGGGGGEKNGDGDVGGGRGGGFEAIGVAFLVVFVSVLLGFLLHFCKDML
ncbi:hypothetical protein M569_10484 [Genlisea aurea]|uniref:Protein odr-4 homolog n=1 Tax=Genlisea aurea TaxID=192259 RepID=S8DWI7_9LAMI|nr:hypothetical protein M569_10484 [Genlisea aurea]